MYELKQQAVVAGKALAPAALPGELAKHSFEVFQRLVQQAVENGTLHSLAEIDGKYFILQSMIEKSFPDKDINEQLPDQFVERRSTRGGTVLLVPVAGIR